MTTTISRGFTAAEQEARHRENLSTEPMQVSCALCEWTASGQAGEVMEAQREHRAGHKLKRSQRDHRSTRHLSTFRQPYLTDDDREEIEAEIARRRRLHGVEEAA